MKTLRLGDIELISAEQNKNYFHCYNDLKEYLSNLGPEYKFTKGKINLYIKEEFSKLLIYNNFSKLYRVVVVSQVSVVNDEGIPIIIDDEDEIERFYSGEECFGFGEDGDEVDTDINRCLSIDVTETESCFIYRII